MSVEQLLNKAIRLEFLSLSEGLFLYKNASLPSLMHAANETRNKLATPGQATWMIDRNVNITNVCISRCRFCNFHTVKGAPGAYITCMDDYKKKVEELFSLGGNQLLLQGGMHPDLKLDFYTTLFRDLKKEFPTLKLHALGPAEVVYLSGVENKTYREILISLQKAGLDSLPGAGAEILADRVRQFVSPAKCSAGEWLDVMREAHKLNILTSATMMFGHYETVEERIEHMIKIRGVQSEKPKEAVGFIAFIPWPFQDADTKLKKEFGIKNNVTADEYIRVLALSRLMLPNINNIQASWLTVGLNIAQICLHAGANDLGSIMIEENVVSAAGAAFRANSDEIQKAIRDAGLEPQKRNQRYEII